MISLNDAQLKTVITVAVGRTPTSRESYVLILRPLPNVDGILCESRIKIKNPKAPAASRVLDGTF
jgi:hypothetical protein